MATLKGERPLFANLIATIKRWLAEFNEWRHRAKGPAPDNNSDGDIPPHDIEPPLDTNVPDSPT